MQVHPALCNRYQRCLLTSQELVEAATLYAEQGAQAEYEVFAALSAMVPPQVLSFVLLCNELTC